MNAPDPMTRLNAALSGRYKIERELGEGGMATVYLARDVKHNRNVALKVLKPELAAVVGAERFLAEIETTAKLSHPHILPLHDSGEADGFLFYVMPHVEGESLRDRLDREHQLPVEDAVRIATNVAEALDYAHRQGVIHRDIKPANILLQDGKPVVSDFGIAIAVGAAEHGRLTETGLSVGTPHYMSPEQATGDMSVGAATDIYALGAVLYEMLVGEPPYTGSTAQAILGKIITEPPPAVTKARKTVPTNVEAAITRALEKVPADRFGDAAQLIAALTDPNFSHGALTGPRTGFGASHGLWNPLSTALAASAVLLAGALLWSSARPEPTRQVWRFEPLFRTGQEPTGSFDLTPDGSSMVYVGPGDDGRGTQLWIRRWDELDARPMPVAEDPDNTLLGSLSISPDGGEVAYFVEDGLKVRPMEGGLTRTLARGLRPYWGEDGWVYFTGGWSLQRTRATGGETEVVTELAENEQRHTWAELLPGGRTLLFTVTGDGLQSGAESEIWSVDLETGQRMFMASGMHARYAPTGHLIFGNADGQLVAAPFDVERVALTGPGVPVADGLDRLERQHTYALSREGDLVYRTGGTGEARELIWVARDGSTRAVADDAVFRWATGSGRGIDGMSLSPDGTRLAYVDFVGGRSDLWSRALPDGAPVRLTFDEAGEQSPTWSPDGESILFARNETRQPGDWTLWMVPASGAGQPELLYHGGADGVWSPDGARLVIRLIGGGDIGPRGLQILRPGIDTVAVPLAANAGSSRATGPAVSPDGLWLAYASNETGRDEVYVRPFPNVASGKWQVSTEGGVQPVWAHSGGELFFLDPSTAELSAVAVTVDGDAFRPGPVTTLFRSPLRPSGGIFAWGRDYGVATNDQEFLMTRLAPDSGSRIVVVHNFFEELKRLAPN